MLPNISDSLSQRLRYRHNPNRCCFCMHERKGVLRLPGVHIMAFFLSHT